MKALAFVLIAATVLVSCKKSDDTTTDPPLTSPGMQAKVEGTLINYGTPTVERQTSSEGETMFISGFTNDGHSIDISFTKQGGITTGSYDQTNNGANIGISDGTNSYVTNKIVGVSITTIDATHMVGTFIGEANDVVPGGAPASITNGKFYVNF